MTQNEQLHMFVDGQHRRAAESREVRDPATGEVIGLAPVGTRSDLDAAVAAARRAQPGWAQQSDEARAQACRQLADIIGVHSGELARLLTREQGKPLKGIGSEFELGGCAAWLNATADLSLPVEVIQDDDTARVEKHHVPLGVIGSITPWNWPLLIAIWHIAPSIRAGNTVVIKPSPYTTLSTLRMVELLAAALPEGVLNVVADGEGVAEGLTTHKDVDKIIFTGSTETGKKIMAAAAPTLKKLTLEMGGNDAGIVLPDVDPKAVAEGIFWGAFINNGQTCAALKRLYVHDDVYDEICAELSHLAQTMPMGPGLDESNVLGPVQNEMQFQKVTRLASSSPTEGGRVITGGAPREGEGFFFPITLIADAREGMACVDEEQFGPLLPIIRFTEVDDAIRQANSLDVDLAASVWSKDIDAARAIAERLVAGTVYINKHGEVAPHIPFGGARYSSMGVEFGIEGLKSCTNIKVYNIAK
ncbi:aldehyde dehydrogenase family protein [Aurantiacibacter flavus]|uniref:Aldehyde dehydrogenase family protein n=1 Tax=Aurantiacibacter flavus TaxID=3145232 RepID=A0ABV0CVL8_9SPHN